MSKWTIKGTADSQVRASCLELQKKHMPNHHNTTLFMQTIGTFRQALCNHAKTPSVCSNWISPQCHNTTSVCGFTEHAIIQLIDFTISPVYTSGHFSGCASDRLAAATIQLNPRVSQPSCNGGAICSDRCPFLCYCYPLRQKTLKHLHCIQTYVEQTKNAKGTEWKRPLNGANVSVVAQ